MIGYVVTTRTGGLVKPGDTLTDTTGDEWTFLAVARGPIFPRKRALVRVRHNYTKDVVEIGADIFGLTVTEATNVPIIGEGRFT